ncbi:hypothetical protein [Paenibacillus sp. GSMTC-2017]|uniref:hypothetical protein n=1 Tax=Paenibacillus sp. GSMTC-2017 TaxID=2794350 RepID=UPI001E6425D2|nr:hypothetical protein [Paenibacillus sp. GSMTC-2017]
MLTFKWNKEEWRGDNRSSEHSQILQRRMEMIALILTNRTKEEYKKVEKKDVLKQKP